MWGGNEMQDRRKWEGETKPGPSWEWGDRKWLSEQPSIHDMYSKTWTSVGRDNEWGLDLQHKMKGSLETVSTRSWL